MSLPVSAEFKEIWERKQGTIERQRLLYNRAYMNGSTLTYEFSETDSTNWHVLEEDDFVDFSEIPWELDTPNENVYRTPVVSIFLEDTQRQWKQSAASPSVWAADSTATDGYQLHRSLFRIQVGYELSDGTTEWLTIFTGMALKPRLRKGGVAEILLASKSAFRLERCEASRVSETSTLEDCIPPTGDGSNKDFESTSTGVDHLTDVQVGAASLAEEDFSVDNLNEVAVPGNTGRAAITTDAAPGAGETVKCSLLRWYRNQLIAAVLALILAEAGVPEADREVDPVVIPGDTAGSKTIDSEAEWTAFATDVNGSHLATSGSLQRKWFLVDNFDDGNYDGWTVAGGSASVVSNRLRIIQGGAFDEAIIGRPFSKAYGTWEFLGLKGTANLFFGFCLSNVAETPTSGYQLNIATGSAPGTLQLLKYVGGASTLLAQVQTDTSGDRTWRITRTSDGDFEVYKDGALVLSASDNEVTTSTYIMFRGFTGGLGYDEVDDIYWSPEADSSGSVSNSTCVRTYTFDLLSAPSAMGTLDRTQDLNGGSVTYKTAGSDDDVTYDALVEISAGGGMLHTPKRYLKIEITITPNGFDSPVIHKLVANFSTSDVFLALAAHGGLTGASAFEMYAKLVDYETGDRTTGARFFRSKTATADPVVSLTQENGIIEVLDWDDGTDDIVNVAAVRSGNKFAKYSCVDAGESAPTSIDKYGRALPPGGELVLPRAYLANNLDIASGRARSLHDRRHLPKDKGRLLIWAVPWLEIGDVVSITIFDDPRQEKTVANDPNQQAGEGMVAFGEAENVLARDKRYKVLQYKPAYRSGMAEIYVEAV